VSGMWTRKTTGKTRRCSLASRMTKYVRRNCCEVKETGIRGQLRCAALRKQTDSPCFALEVSRYGCRRYLRERHDCANVIVSQCFLFCFINKLTGFTFYWSVCRHDNYL
jgi:hypothetical protein